MLNFLKKSSSFSTRLLLFIYFALLAVSALAPLSNNNVIPNQADLYNHVAAIVRASTDMFQQFPLRVTNLRTDGLLYPFFQFYAPTSYLFSGLIYKYITSSNPYIAYKITVWLALILGGIFLYRLAFRLTKSIPAALLAGTVFITAPYLNILIGALGALNEVMAIMMIPFILFYTMRDYENPSKLKYLLLVSAGWYVLITTHLITFIYAALLMGIFLFLLTWQTKQWNHFIRAGIAIAFGGVLATWFLVPAILFSHYFSVADSFPTAQSIYETSANLSSMLSPMLSKILNMQQNVVTRAHAAIGMPILMGVGVAVYAWVRRDEQYDSRMIPLLIIFFIAFFMLWSPINIWKYLPSSLLVIQYTMRMLAQLTWIGALIFSLSVYGLFNKLLDKRHAAVGILLIIAATNSLLPTLADGSYLIKDIIKKPILTFNPDAYIIDPLKSSSLVGQIDDYILDTLYVNGKLQFKNVFNIPLSLLKLAKKPEIVLEGDVLNKNKSSHYLLEVLAGGNVIDQITLSRSQPINWHIPLNINTMKITNDIVPIQFRLKNADGNIIIQVTKISLTGFVLPEETMTLHQLNPICKTKRDELICDVNVQQGISLLELPMLYYPKLMHVTINNKEVPYHGVLVSGKIFVGVVPVLGKNNIHAKFVGLSWANTASLIGWALWLIVFAYAVVRRNR